MNTDSMTFVVYMIHQCAKAWQNTPAQVYEKLKLSGCIDRYLVPHYDILHTQSTDYVLQDIRTYLQERGMAG